MKPAIEHDLRQIEQRESHLWYMTLGFLMALGGLVVGITYLPVGKGDFQF